MVGRLRHARSLVASGWLPPARGAASVLWPAAAAPAAACLASAPRWWVVLGCRVGSHLSWLSCCLGKVSRLSGWRWQLLLHLLDQSVQSRPNGRIVHQHLFQHWGAHSNPVVCCV